jgi:hypothetical protein
MPPRVEEATRIEAAVRAEAQRAQRAAEAAASPADDTN